MFFVKISIVTVIGVLASGFDLFTDKIPNWLIVGGLVIGLGYEWEIMGSIGILFWLVGVSVPLVLLFTLFLFRALGAGDIKLLCVFGGFLGGKAILGCIVAAFLAGAMMAVIVMMMNRNFLKRLRYLLEYIYELLRTRKWKPYYVKGKKNNTIHFSIPVTVSVLLYLGGLI